MVAKFQFIVLLLPLIIIITAPLRVERSLNLFYSSPRSLYIYIYMYMSKFRYIYIYNHQWKN